MRFFEFGSEDAGLDKFIMILRNYIGRAASKHASAKLNWNGLSQVARASNFEFATDYGTFKAMYDSNPALQALVKNFNAQGVELQVPGAPNDDTQSPQDGQTSQEKVDQTADSAAASQLAQSQSTPKV